jgi:hydrogenase maturation protease
MIRVLGLGSPFGDDRAGWWVVHHLRGNVPPSVDLVTLDRPGAALIHWMTGVRHLVIIDAVVDDGPPGRILKVPLERLTQVTSRYTSHQLTLVATLQLARTLGDLPTLVEIYGVTIAGPGQGSPLVEAAAGRLAADLGPLLTVAAEDPREASRHLDETAGTG